MAFSSPLLPIKNVSLEKRRPPVGGWISERPTLEDVPPHLATDHLLQEKCPHPFKTTESGAAIRLDEKGPEGQCIALRILNSWARMLEKKSDQVVQQNALAKAPLYTNPIPRGKDQAMQNVGGKAEGGQGTMHCYSLSRPF